MNLIIICPKCGKANSIENISCTGKFRSGKDKGKPCTVRNLKKNPNKIYAIDYRANGKRIRERIGPSMALAQQRLLEIKKIKDQGESPVSVNLCFDQLFDWYIALHTVRSRTSYRRISAQIKSLRRILGTSGKVMELSVRQLECYVSQRSSEDSPSRKGEKIAPKTVKEEINLLSTMINRAIDYKILVTEPLSKKLYPKILVDNVRTKIFTENELDRILTEAPLWMRRIIIMAQGTGMRQNEVVQLTWDKIDLERGFVRLRSSETKTKQARSVKLSAPVMDMLMDIPRVSHTNHVFLSATQKPLSSWTTYCHEVWKKTLSKAGVEEACFHDLRHDFVTKAIRNGNPSHLVMKQVGHKTDDMLRRYNLIDETDLEGLRL